jgi:hypothetical protein
MSKELFPLFLRDLLSRLFMLIYFHRSILLKRIIRACSLHRVRFLVYRKFHREGRADINATFINHYVVLPLVLLSLLLEGKVCV